MKALLVNGSPHKQGNTGIALGYVADSLREEGIEAEIYHIPRGPVSGCNACGACASRDNRCVIDGDAVNVILEKMKDSDAFIVGSPVYYASPNGQLLSVLDRVFFAGGAELFAGKPGAAVCAVRRGGASATLDTLQKYFPISGMPIAPSTYWPMIHGAAPGESRQDAEGVQEMHMLGKTVAWMLKCFEAGKREDFFYPQIPGAADGEKIFTNFIR
jgi:multimeric flavodoxin WrbA